MNFKSKMKKYLVMKNNPLLAPHLPEMHVLTHITQKYMLIKHRCVYLKPDIGSCGRGIFRLELLKDGRVKLQTKMDPYPQYYSGINSLPSINRYRPTYLVQQGIDLIESQGSLVDFRWIVAQTRPGKWKYVGVVARQGQKGRVVTNYSAGGKAVNPLEVLPGDFKRNLSCMKNIAEESSSTWGKEMTSRSVFGVDIGMDKKGEFWLLEINNSPRIKMFSKESVVSNHVKERVKEAYARRKVRHA